jgi:inhibitor of KinA
MNSMPHFEPLGDQAVMAYCANENQAMQLAASVRKNMPDWCIDVVQAYVSVAIYYDLNAIDYDEAAKQVQGITADELPADGLTGRLHVIPCCYELGLDFERIERHTHLDREAIVTLHTGTIYTVYAIGFCPGFPYLGYLPTQLCGVPRLDSPRLHVEAGCVGLTGRQTGIYTEPRPGGWNIIGRTPLQLVDVEKEYFPLRTGDQVRFHRIDKRKYDVLQADVNRRRLPYAD